MNPISEPSKFVVSSFATYDEIWMKILEVLTPLEIEDADRSASDINEPYLGYKEVTIRRKDHSLIAFASLSETTGETQEWAIYRET